MPLSLVVDIFNENDCYILKHVKKTLKFITIFNFFKVILVVTTTIET